MNQSAHNEFQIWARSVDCLPKHAQRAQEAKQRGKGDQQEYGPPMQTPCSSATQKSQQSRSNAQIDEWGSISSWKKTVGRELAKGASPLTIFLSLKN